MAVGQIQLTTCFCKLSFIGTQPHPFIYLLPMAAFTLQWQHWAVVTETV